MNRNKLGKSILSFVLVVGAVVSTAVDWNATHLFNPAWHPHARFHDALFLLIVDGISLVGLWLLWRKSKEPDIALKVAALTSVIIWTPFFYITPLIPGTSLLASEDVPVLRVAGMAFPPNWRGDRRGGRHANMALEGLAFHWRRGDGFGCGVFASNAWRHSLRATLRL